MNKYNENAKGIIINIKHGTSKEGPGWRSIIYFILNFIRICFSLRKLKSNNFFEVRKVPTSS